MYRARREWAWNEQAEQVYQEKRQKLAGPPSTYENLIYFKL